MPYARLGQNMGENFVVQCILGIALAYYESIFHMRFNMFSLEITQKMYIAILVLLDFRFHNSAHFSDPFQEIMLSIHISVLKGRLWALTEIHNQFLPSMIWLVHTQWTCIQ